MILLVINNIFSRCGEFCTQLRKSIANCSNSNQKIVSISLNKVIKLFLFPIKEIMNWPL